MGSTIHVGDNSRRFCVFLLWEMDGEIVSGGRGRREGGERCRERRRPDKSEEEREMNGQYEDEHEAGESEGHLY